MFNYFFDSLALGCLAWILPTLVKLFLLILILRLIFG